MAEHNPFPGENNTGHVWDENLRELNNNPPSWWMIGFWASVIWWVGYGVLYPMWPMGQQPTKGILGWTQIGEYKDGLKEVDAVRAQHEQKVKSLDAAAVLADPGLRQYAQARGKVLFGDYCAACHGSGGQGNPGYPILADDDWLYGGGIAKISETITLGRQGAMPAHVGTLTEQEIDQLAHMVVSQSGQEGRRTGSRALSEQGLRGLPRAKRRRRSGYPAGRYGDDGWGGQPPRWYLAFPTGRVRECQADHRQRGEPGGPTQHAGGRYAGIRSNRKTFTGSDQDPRRLRPSVGRREVV